jgi:hypothetical protein
MSLWTMTDNDAGKPKYLSDTLRNGQTVSDLDATLGVSATEAADTGSKSKGLGTAGWVKYATYTDANGNTRHKSEVLVAAGSMGADATPATLVDDLSTGTLTTVTLTSTADYITGSSATRTGTAISIIGRPASTNIAKLLLLQVGDTMTITTQNGTATATLASVFSTSDAGGGYLYYNATSVQSVTGFIEGDIVFDVIVP